MINSMNSIFKNGFIRLILVGGVVWMALILSVLIFHILSCGLSSSLLSSSICNRHSIANIMTANMGLISDNPPHRCEIPLLSNPNSVIIPEQTSDHLIQHLSYTKDSSNTSRPFFGGRPSWSARADSFKIKPKMTVNCGFFREGVARLSVIDAAFTSACRFVVASGIFDGYDIPRQPKNISRRSKELFCFLMVVDKVSFDMIVRNSTVIGDPDGGKRVGVWRIVVLGKVPYDEPRRNGKVPKILAHRLFPAARYSIWIDGKMELVVDPLLILERYLWRGGHTFAVARHKHHRSVYEEADAIKRRKRYARPLVDLQMRMYYHEGMMSWGPGRDDGREGDVPEGAVIIREHTMLTNLFSCLWFNEVDMLTPRDQLSFGYVAYRLGRFFKFFMFPNCEYNSLFVLHPHTREHSSSVEWVKSMEEFGGRRSTPRESRGGLGLWTPYPANLSSVVLPNVTRTSKAG